eukprot:5694125-Alexandrium_andersonii.AAC.1
MLPCCSSMCADLPELKGLVDAAPRPSQDGVPERRMRGLRLLPLASISVTHTGTPVEPLRAAR